MSADKFNSRIFSTAFQILIAPAILISGPLAFAQTEDLEQVSGYGDEDDSSDTVEEIVVQATRASFTPISAETPDVSFNSADIAALGVSDISELLEALTAETATDSDAPPILLLDSRPVASKRDIQKFPSEAVLRVEILPPQAALKFSADPDRRVINFVLRRRFNAITNNLDAGTTTEGGRDTFEGSSSFLRIFKKSRLALNAGLKSQSALSEFDRDIEDRNAGRLFAQGGNLTARIDGGELDSGLSLAAGETVTIAALPQTAGDDFVLSDFTATANAPITEDQRRFRDLRPDTQVLTLGGSLFRPLTDRHSLNASLNADFTGSESLRGLSNSQIDIDAGTPFSPFENDVRLFRSDGPLIRESEKSDIDANISLFGDYPTRRWELSAQYGRVDDSRETDRRIDTLSLRALQDDIDAGTVNPFGPSGINQKSISDRVAENFTLKGRINARLLMLPAGPVTGSAGVEYAGTDLESSVNFNGISSTNNLTRGSTEIRGQVDIPLTGEWASNSSAAGRSRLRLSGSADKVDNFGILKSYGGGLDWNITDKIQLQGTADIRERAPSLSQLGDPVLIDPNIRVTDFESGRAVFVDRISGGNSDLKAETRRDLQFTAKYRPSRALSLSTRYKSRITDDDITSFPFLTPQVAEAFPDRLQRDESGQLQSLDARPVNAFRTQVDSLRTGFNWNKRFESRKQDEQDGASQSRESERERRRERRRRGGKSDRLSVSLYHTLRITEDFQFRKNGPVFDLLNGSALRRQGGEAENEVQARISFRRKNYGGRIELNHETGSFISTESLTPGQARGGDIVFDPLTTADLRFNYDLGRRADGRRVRRSDWKSGLRLTLDIENITDSKQSVKNAAGITPFGYEQDALDPEGRTVMFSLRKIFMSRINDKSKN